MSDAVGTARPLMARKPAEPTGQQSAVVDADGLVWTRSGHRWHHVDEHGHVETRIWPQVDAVRVIRFGRVR